MRLTRDREKVHEGIKEVVKPFDWSYTTAYRGTLTTKTSPLQPTTTPIPLDLLKKPDPIIFFDDVMLYEDELADNGITMLSVKIRVMPARLLLLSRFFMRLDDVMFRIRDTRVYVEFATGEVIREYVAKEQEYEEVRRRVSERGEGEGLVVMRDANRLADLLPVVDKKLDMCILK